MIIISCNLLPVLQLVDTIQVLFVFQCIFGALKIESRPQWEDMNKPELTSNWPCPFMNQPRMNESVNCSGQHRRGDVRNEVNCNGSYVRGVTWSVSKRGVNRGVFWAKEDKRAECKKRTRYKCDLLEDVKPIQHICSSLTLINPLSTFVMQHLALSAHLRTYCMSGWYTLKCKNVSVYQTHRLCLLICAWPFVWKMGLES